MPRGPRCSIFGCNARPIRGYEILLCPGHRAQIITDQSGNGLGRCAWPGCDQWGLQPTRHCATHIALVAYHGLGYPAASAAYSALADSKATTKREPVAPKVGTIYYLRSGAYFKIGWTGNLEQRMKSFAPDTQLLATHPGTQKEERAQHKRFAHLLARGREWFMLAPEIEDHIASVVAEHGAPPVVDFTARRATRTPGRQKQYVGGPNRGSLAARQVRG